jgi:hypothetical protein
MTIKNQSELVLKKNWKERLHSKQPNVQQLIRPLLAKNHRRKKVMRHQPTTKNEPWCVLITAPTNAPCYKKKKFLHYAPSR